MPLYSLPVVDTDSAVLLLCLRKYCTVAFAGNGIMAFAVSVNGFAPGVAVDMIVVTTPLIRKPSVLWFPPVGFLI